MSRAPTSSARARSCRFAGGRATVTWTDDLVAGVRLSPWSRGFDDRRLARSLNAVLSGARIPRSLRVDPKRLSSFERAVLGACAGIRPGHVATYGELARKIGKPGSARAVGQVLARNPFPLLIPCHRVVAAGGGLRGFGPGIEWKARLLAAEGWHIGGTGASRRVRLGRGS